MHVFCLRSRWTVYRSCVGLCSVEHVNLWASSTQLNLTSASYAWTRTATVIQNRPRDIPVRRLLPFPAAESVGTLSFTTPHQPSTHLPVSFRFYGSNRLHCVVSEARSCEQRVQGCHASCSIPSLYAEFACKCNPSKHALSSDARKVIEDNEVLTWFESRWLFRTLSLNAEYMHLHYYDVVNNALFVTGIAAGRYRRLCARRPITLFVSCTALLYYTSHAACSQQRCSATTNWTWWMNEWMNRSINLFARKCRRQEYRMPRVM